MNSRTLHTFVNKVLGLKAYRAGFLNFDLLNIVGFSALSVLSSANAAFGQVVPVGTRADDTLGLESSVVIDAQNNTSLIQGGASRGANLFHSFETFNVPTGNTTFFVVPGAEIENIFSRITGDELSLVDGVLGAIDPATSLLSGADFYLMNPNGVIFGPSSRLALGGNLVITTADALKFDEQGTFSAQTPVVPSLLTVNPSAFLFSRSDIASITIASQDLTLPRQENEVLEGGKDLFLVGGDINVQSSILFAAAGGGVNIGGLATPGEVELLDVAGRRSLNFPDGAALADVVWNGSTLLLTGDGDINIAAQDISVDNESRILSVLVALPELGNTSGGDLNIVAEGTVAVDNASIIVSGILGNEDLDLITDDSGDVNITARNIKIDNRSIVFSTSVSPGTGGDLNLNATEEVRLENNSIVGTPSLETETTNADPNPLLDLFVSSGSSGNTSIVSSNIVLDDSVIVSANTASTGEAAGNISINASDTLQLRNRGLINASTRSLGDAGNIEIYAKNLISLQGRNEAGISSTITTSIIPVVGATESRRGGDISISTGQRGVVQLDDSIIGSNVQSGSSGEGGKVSIRTNELLLEGGSQIQTILDGETDEFSGGRGRAGNIEIVVSDSLVAERKNSQGDPSGLATITRVGAIGDAGDIAITANSILFSEANVVSETRNAGDAGQLEIHARDIQLINTTGISSRSLGRGDGGDVTITADDVDVQSGSFVSASSGSPEKFGDLGSGGDVNINVTGSLEIEGTARSLSSGLFTRTTSVSDAGDIDIKAGQIMLREGGSIATNAIDLGGSGGNAGNITISATDFVEIAGVGQFSRSTLATDTNGKGNAGQLVIVVPRLSLQDGGEIVSATFGQGNAADITIEASDIVVSGAGRGDSVSQIQAGAGPEASGQGGTIRVDTDSLVLENGGRISASSQSADVAGNISISARDRITLQDGEISTTAASANGGEIVINGSSEAQSGILLAEDSNITAESAGDGGNVRLMLPVVALGDSNIIARSQNTNGGNIEIESLFSSTLPPDGEAPFEGDGKVDVNADGQLSSGIIVIPDTSFIQNSLADLPEQVIDPDSLVAASCVAQTDEEIDSFVTAAADGLPVGPGNTATGYSTGDISDVETTDVAEAVPETPVVESELGEPELAYRLPDGRVLLTQACR